MRPAFLRAEARIDLGCYTAVEGLLLAHPLHAAARQLLLREEAQEDYGSLEEEDDDDDDDEDEPGAY
jgi:hypothetical protein